MSLNGHEDSPTTYVCRRGGLEQRLICADLEGPGTFSQIRALLPDAVGFVYSDPPWNPGNATYWRTHAGRNPCESYDRFLDSWVRVVTECISRGASDVFCEQSSNVKHRGLLLDAVKRESGWTLPLLEEWTVRYGSRGSTAASRPNALLHFGTQRIPTDPSDMAGEPMTIRACAGVRVAPGSWVVDPCMGKGMTSRMAHYFGWNAVGSELNHRRLGRTVEWLERRGYTVEAR